MEVTVDEMHGSDIFPENVTSEAGGKNEYVIRFNDNVDVLLALYNRLMMDKIDTGKAIIEYVLFQACMVRENYSLAQTCLDNFKNQLATLTISKMDDEMAKNQYELICSQIYLLLIHEASHLLFTHRPTTKEAEMLQTKELLQDMKEDLDSFRNQDDGSRGLMGLVMRIGKKILERTSYNVKYLESVINGDEKKLIEELSCDRVAWLTMLNVLHQNNEDGNVILQMNLYFYIALSAMEYNKVLQSQYIPSYHGKVKYEGRKVLLRQNALKSLLRQYSPEANELYRHQCADLTKGIGKILPQSFMAMYSKQSIIKELYSNASGIVRPNHKERSRLNAEMQGVVSEYLGL